MTTYTKSSVQLVAYVGSYGAHPGAEGGGIYQLCICAHGTELTVASHLPSPVEAGYLVYAEETSTLYVVDERKTDGRGPVNPPAAVHALRVDREDGTLTPLNWLQAPGPRPTYLAYSPKQRLLFSANHGDFQHVEKVVRDPDGGWKTRYEYDDSTVVVYGVEENGQLAQIEDVLVLDGYGTDPNSSPQNGGHAQASPHAHSAVVDPSEQYLLVCDKGTDRIYVYSVGPQPKLLSVCQFEAETAPRHITFSSPTRAYLTLELSSEIVALDFDVGSAELRVLSRCSTVADGFTGRNEPAEVRVHPNGRFVYVNNRGEDSLAWFEIFADGRLRRAGAVRLARSIHPGLAARSFAFAPCGEFMLVADRPGHQIRSYAVSPESGGLALLAEVQIPDPVYIEFAHLTVSEE
ncbi:beta-propeller fold lactonase family protein [Pseudomonas plecoglossicida]|uniref:lactonase family protein n=1 Tax=Pseudomonas TaxID=286 RepID=UPI0016653CB3|nr:MULTISPECIES: beta-propeller fold lactonase family protein [Pseudomonas]MDH1932194.1 lactonase family protein [Pseudomonas sp. GD03696]MDM1714511.1 lactonase family protein [Pseudomonas sp. 165]MDQ7967619.1 beta-propeller fold lactonase family protein [Pseudomonas plecoglossicida]QNT41778.1 lactonase family protein [Pseudomonas asiatica]WFG03815.1 beta-propeller fold lactonase family protein [Pseudomonas putida]